MFTKTTISVELTSYRYEIFNKTKFLSGTDFAKYPTTTFDSSFLLLGILQRD